MESAREDLCSVIQYYKGPDTGTNNTEVTLSDSSKNQNFVKDNIKGSLNESSKEFKILRAALEANRDNTKGEIKEPSDISLVKTTGHVHYNSTSNESQVESNVGIKSKEFKQTGGSLGDSEVQKSEAKWFKTNLDSVFKSDAKKEKGEVPEAVKRENIVNSDAKIKETETKDVNLELTKNENEMSIKGKKRTMSEANSETASVAASVASAEEVEGNEDAAESEFDEDDDEGAGPKLRRRGRCKKNPDIIPSHLSSDMVLGYKILLKFLETPQFSGFHKPFKKSAESEENCKITCLNQIKKKFEENLYKKVSEFVNDVREMLMNIYESRNQVAIKKALRLEQILEQRIAQLPNYLRPQCALVLSSDEVNNCHNKIRITKGGGFVSLLLEKTEKKRYEKNREKRKLLAEERKQLKEEQDKDVQEWEKNVLLKDFEEDIKSMWELPAIGHFIHLCADIFNIGEVAQFEVERMLLMPQCSDTLDLIMTALLTNCLVRAKLDRTPSMPYSIWGPLVRTRVMSWYRMWHRDGKNEQKIFEEIGIEPEFWQILGPDINPLDYYYFHEISLFQRVWILKTLCDVDFVRKKTVYDNIRAQTLDELSPVNLGLDQQGNRYIQFKQFCGSDIRIYRQSSKLDGDITPSELIESIEGFEYREGPITAEKVFKDIWELNEKAEVKPRKKKIPKNKRVKNFNAKVSREPVEKKNLRQSAREKQKTYVDWSDSDQSDTDLRTLRNKLLKSGTETLHRPFSNREFISLSVFRLPREKVNKLTPKRSSYAGRRTEDSSKNESDKTIKTEPEERKEEAKPPCEEEQSDSLDVKQVQNTRTDFGKNFQGDDLNEDEFDLREKINNCELDNNDVKFTVTNLENLKMVFKKGASAEREESGENISGNMENSKSEESTREKEYDLLYKYNVPNHLKPDSSKFYLVVDSVEGLRQLISKFGSHENDLEIITRSTKSKKKNNNTSSEVQLIERLQNLLIELEPWELDLMKSSRLNKEKMYKEYMNFINRPPDFVHPNEAYWMKTYEDPPSTTASSSTTTTTATTATADGTASNCDKSNKEAGATTGESGDANHQDTPLDTLGLRKRTRVSRVQLQPESDDLDEDFDGGDDYESNESDDNWVLPTSKKRPKKEPANRTPKLPRRSVNKRTKSSPLEKTDSQANAGEKSQGSSPEKVKKALFWGPRSSDPSEDLNWETNRQKILEQHNSPVKKLIKPDEANDLTELENARHNIPKYGSPSQSVIIASPKSLPQPIPGNKKPYFSSTQLKAMESQAKKIAEEAQQKNLGPANNTPKEETENADNGAKSDSASLESFNQPPFKKIQTYSRNKKPLSSPTGGGSSQTANSFAPAPAGEGGSSATTANSQAARYGPQICSTAAGGGAEQKQIGQVQILQPGIQPQQIQIQDLGQNRVITSNVKMQQPVQWQQKVISVQPVNQTGKMIQNQGQPQPQVQIQSQPQTQVQVHPQGQQSARLELQKLAPSSQYLQVPVEKLGNFLQMVATQAQTETVQPEGDLFITDGKNLMKFDNNFVQELQKDKVMNLDLKKTLLLVKPKANSNQSTSQGQTQVPTSEHNILVINKPAPVQQPAPATFIANFIVPVNYIIKDNNQQTQAQQTQQAVKLVQPSPTYVIQQKALVNKAIQPQVIKIITTQPAATNQNIILTPVAGQVIQPVAQNTVVTSEQQTKPPTSVRLIRPPIATSLASNPAQNKINVAQNPIIVNNIVQIQGQKLDGSKPQTSVVPARIVSTAVPTVRMASPQTVLPTQSIIQTKPVAGAQSQTQTVVAAANVNHQAVRSNVITQPVRLATITQGQVQAPINSNNPSPRFVVSSTPTIRIAGTPKTQTQTSTTLTQTQPIRFTNPQQFVVPSSSTSQTIKPTVINTQQVRLATTQPHTFIQAASVSPQIIRPAATMNTQTVRLVSQPQFVQTQTLVTSTSAGPSPSGNSNIQPVKIVQPQQFQTQAVVPCASLDSQTARVGAGINSQPIRFVQSQPVRLVAANNNADMKIINRSPAPVRADVKVINRTPAPASAAKAAVITSAGHTPVAGVSSAKPAGVVSEPVRYQAIVQPSAAKPAQHTIQLITPKKTVKANTAANAPVVVVEDEEEEEISILGEKLKEPPVTLDFINGELSVKKTSQGWKYAVKASNGKDIVLTDEQIEKRLKANNGVMK